MAVTYTPPSHGFRTFLVLWATQSLSVIGSAMTGFVLNVYLAQTLYPGAHQKAELAFAFTALNLASAVPFIFGGPVAGAWTDRLDRRMILLVANAASGMLTLAMLLLMLAGPLNVWALVAIGILGSTVGAFHFAAFDASYAMLVPDRLLARANGMMWTTWSLAGIVSPALAAFILAWPALGRQGLAPFGPLASITDATPLVIAIDTATFVVAAVALLLLDIPSPVRSDLAASGSGRPSLWADIREGALFIWDRRPVVWLLGTFTVANLAVAPAGVLIPLLVKFNLADDWLAQGYTFETALALLTVTAGIGGLIGGLLISTWGGLEKRRVYGVLIPMLLGGIAQIAYGFSPLVLLCAVAAFIKALMEPVFNAHSQAIWQSITPRELQGRVFSVRRLIAQATRPLGTAAAGTAAGVLDPGYVYGAFGLVWVVFCAVQLFNPYMLRVEDKAGLEQLATSRR
jgi:MFS transporter, DHA3 family, macrolide efflux protein